MFATPPQFTGSLLQYQINKNNVSCKNKNQQWFPWLVDAWDVIWCEIVSVDPIAHGINDCRTVMLTMIFYRSLVSESSVTSLGVHTRWWLHDNITLHSLCYLARVRHVIPLYVTCRPCGHAFTSMITSLIPFWLYRFKRDSSMCQFDFSS